MRIRSTSSLLWLKLSLKFADDTQLLTVVGARPQFIKAAAVSRAIAAAELDVNQYLSFSQ